MIGYILLLIIVLLFIWAMILFLIDSKENRAIRKSGIKEELVSHTEEIIKMIDDKVAETKTFISELNEEREQLCNRKDRPDINFRLFTIKQISDFKYHIQDVYKKIK